MILLTFDVTLIVYIYIHQLPSSQLPPQESDRWKDFPYQTTPTFRLLCHSTSGHAYKKDFEKGGLFLILLRAKA